MYYLKFDTAFHNACFNLSTQIYQTPFYGVVEGMVHFKMYYFKITHFMWLLQSNLKYFLPELFGTFSGEFIFAPRAALMMSDLFISSVAIVVKFWWA